MITKEELNHYPKFYIETTARECFEIEKLEQGYRFTDITPPIMGKVVSDYKSIKIPQKIVEKVNKNPNYEFNAVDSTKILYFEGIGKGFSLLSMKSKDKLPCLKVGLKNYLSNKISAIICLIFIFSSRLEEKFH
jgi:hypothetical protein